MIDVNLLLTVGGIVVAIAMSWAVNKTVVAEMRKKIEEQGKVIDTLREELRNMPSIRERCATHADRLRAVEIDVKEILANRVTAVEMREMRQEISAVHKDVRQLVALVTGKMGES